MKNQHQNQIFGEMACGIASQIKLEAGQKDAIEFNLVWDMPVVSYPDKKRKYQKFYTTHFGSENATLKIVDYSFKNYKNWQLEIYNWQIDVLDDP